MLGVIYKYKKIEVVHRLFWPLLIWRKTKEAGSRVRGTCIGSFRGKKITWLLFLCYGDGALWRNCLAVINYWTNGLLCWCNVLFMAMRVHRKYAYIYVVLVCCTRGVFFKHPGHELTSSLAQTYEVKFVPSSSPGCSKNSSQFSYDHRNQATLS